jgi:hypothetical protein
LADQHGFVVIYSDGYRRNWNDCRKYATFPAKRQNIDDMSFFRTLIGRASVEYPRRLRLCSGFGSSTTSPSSLARFRFTSARSFPTSSVIFFSISATATHRRQHRQAIGAVETVDMLTAGISAWRSTGATLFAPTHLSCLAVAYAMLGQVDEAQPRLS